MERIKGAALLGAAGAELITNPAAEFRARAVTDTVIEPGPALIDTYRELLREFSHCYDHKFGFWNV